jgi:hypothetical protein
MTKQGATPVFATWPEVIETPSAGRQLEARAETFHGNHGDTARHREMLNKS